MLLRIDYITGPPLLQGKNPDFPLGKKFFRSRGLFWEKPLTGPGFFATLWRLFSRLGPGAKQALNLTGVNGIFWFAWAFGNYQNIYLQQVGFAPSQLGLLNAIASAVGIASVAFWGMVSDRLGSVKKVLIAVLGGGALFYSLVPLIPAGTAYTVLALTIALPLINFFRGSMSTFAENLLVRNCNELRLNYGLLRSLGSILFTVGSLIISSLLPFVGVGNTFWLCGVLMLIPIGFTFFSREPSAGAKPAKKKGGGMHLGELFQNRAYLLFLGFSLIFYICTTCEANYIPYFMAAVDVPSEQYGVLMGYRALFEVPFLLLMVRLRRRFPLRILVIFSPVLMALECLGFFLFARSLPTILLFCTFYGLGNGLFIGSSLNYLYELAPDHLKASAQAFFVAVSSVAGILGNLLGGVLFDGVGAAPFYAVVAGLFLLSALIFYLSIRWEKKSAQAA